MRKFFGKRGSNAQAGAATVKDVRQGGIGIVLQKDAANRMVVVRLVAGGPAEESGTVLAGDVLQDVGGVEPPAGGWEMADVLALIIGAHGTPVQLGLRRGTSQIRTSIVRQATAAPLQPQVPARSAGDPPPHDAGNAGAGAAGAAAGQKEQRRQFNLVAPNAQDMAGTSTGSIFKRPTPAQLLKGASLAATATSTSRAADAFKELSLSGGGGGGGHDRRKGGEEAGNAGAGGMPRLEGGADVSQVGGGAAALLEEPDEEARNLAEQQQMMAMMRQMQTGPSATPTQNATHSRKARTRESSPTSPTLFNKGARPTLVLPPVQEAAGCEQEEAKATPDDQGAAGPVEHAAAAAPAHAFSAADSSARQEVE